jgi:5-formyltetrahydrofolate cyclo-ligase
VAIAAAKQRLRREIGALRRAVAPSRRRLAGEAVARHVLAFPGLRAAGRVALYAGLPDEVPTAPLLRALLERGHAVLLPRVGDSERLEFAFVPDESALVLGRFGALEPPPGARAVPLRAGDLVLVPGVAFDRSGSRLGRGGGWYDRSLPDDVRDLFGVAFELQLVAHVPVTTADRRVRGVFTEHGLHQFGSANASRESDADPS